MSALLSRSCQDSCASGAEDYFRLLTAAERSTMTTLPWSRSFASAPRTPQPSPVHKDVVPDTTGAKIWGRKITLLECALRALDSLTKELPQARDSRCPKCDRVREASETPTAQARLDELEAAPAGRGRIKVLPDVRRV